MSGLQSIALDRFGLGTGALHEGRDLTRIIHPVEFGALSFKHLASSEHT